MILARTALAVLLAVGVSYIAMAETQLTFVPQGHDLDNNDNFSPDGRFLVYDTRETVGPGIDNSTVVERIEIATGERTTLYHAEPARTGTDPAPGVGAASYSPDGSRIAFIHGPPLVDVPERGPYGKTNRCGAEVLADGSRTMIWLDVRDVATDRDTLPGAHRGGTHRHEYSRNGKRIGYTYDDHLLPQYDRTVGYMEAHEAAPEGVSHYTAILVPIVPKDTAKPGEIEKAWGDSWVDPEGTLRAFIGLVREEDSTMEQSLFTVSVPKDVDITTADSGGPDRFPAPPEGTRIQRLTHTWAEGIVRGAPDGSRIAYYGRDAAGNPQFFVVAADGSDEARQVTDIPQGVETGLRWHPNGQTLFGIGNNGIFAVSVAEDDFGAMTWIVAGDDGPERTRLVVSPDGGLLAYNKAAPTRNDAGEIVKNYAGEDFMQIFTVR